LLFLFFYPEDGGEVFLRNVTFSEIDGVTPQRIELMTVFVLFDVVKVLRCKRRKNGWGTLLKIVFRPIKERAEHEAGENCTVRSLLICILHQK
jgi:hypothetical protein